MTTYKLNLVVNGCTIPIDPHTGEPLVLQTWWKDDPWRVCVTSLLLVATRRSQVEPMLEAFYAAWPSARAILLDPGGVESLLRPLGLSNQRYGRLLQFNADWLDGKPVRECYGVGPYVEASYRLVYLQDQWCETDDPILMIYRAWLRSLDFDPLRKVRDADPTAAKLG